MYRCGRQKWCRILRKKKSQTLNTQDCNFLNLKKCIIYYSLFFSRRKKRSFFRFSFQSADQDRIGRHFFSFFVQFYHFFNILCINPTYSAYNKMMNFIFHIFYRFHVFYDLQIQSKVHHPIVPYLQCISNRIDIHLNPIFTVFFFCLLFDEYTEYHLIRFSAHGFEYFIIHQP